MRLLKLSLFLFILIGCPVLFADQNSSTPSQVDSLLNYAYDQRGITTREDIHEILAGAPEHPKVLAFKEFIGNHSLENAKALMLHADTLQSKSLAYICMAEAYYAKNKPIKALLFATLSLAGHPTELREAQVKLYLTGSTSSEINILAPKDQVIANLNAAMDASFNPQTLRRYFSMASIIGLLPSFPLVEVEQPLQKPIDICMAFDKNFAAHGAVTILSAILSAAPGTQYTFHIMEDIDNPLGDEYKARISNLVEEIDPSRFKIVFTLVDGSILPESLQHIKQFSIWPRLVFFKLYIPQIFADKDRILWLDADMIITDDLSELYHTPMDGKWFAGVRDREGYKVPSYLPLQEGVPYLNVGMVLYDNVAINSAKGCDWVTEYCLSHPGFETTLKYPEQDMFSLIYSCNILEIEKQQSKADPIEDWKIPRWNWFYTIDNDSSWKNIHSHPAAIIHLAGGKYKPWRRKSSPFLWSWSPKRNDGVQNLYWALRDMTPWPMY